MPGSTELTRGWIDSSRTCWNTLSKTTVMDHNQNKKRSDLTRSRCCHYRMTRDKPVSAFFYAIMAAGASKAWGLLTCLRAAPACAKCLSVCVHAQAGSAAGRRTGRFDKSFVLINDSELEGLNEFPKRKGKRLQLACWLSLRPLIPTFGSRYTQSLGAFDSINP